MNREYIYIEATSSFCNECMTLVPAKIVSQDNSVYIIKYCPDHGETKALLEEDYAYHMKKRHYDKPSTSMITQTQINKGCPFDCGICLMHDQHACIGLIEVTNACNLACPTCYANAGEDQFLSLEKISDMMDLFIESERGKGEILQISGGEPSLHPQILDIIEMAQDKGIQYVMLNTNGLRIAEDETFVKALKGFKGGFEVYMQFDGFKESTYESLRGENILETKLKAIDLLVANEVPVTLVTTVAKGVNDDELGKIFEFALSKPFIRGINYQPVAYFGRVDNDLASVESQAMNRSTLSSILGGFERQTGGLLTEEDFIPLPCNVERVAITYLSKTKSGGFLPITRNMEIQKKYLHLINNTFAFTIEDMLNKAGEGKKNLSTLTSCCDLMSDFKKFLPMDFMIRSKEKKMAYIDANTFRVSISSFVDRYNFDLKSMQKECVHVITKDLKKIPFSAYNILYREAQS